MRLRILTLNTWKCDGAYRHRLDLMVAGLARLSPDVLLLQEVFASREGHADTAAQLAQVLSMTATVAPARSKARWIEGRNWVSSSGLALLTREPVLSQHVVALPTDGADGERIAQCVHVSHAGHAFWVANVHLTHLSQASNLRSRQLRTCLDALQRYAGSGPAMIGGDFNAGPGDPEFDALTAPPACLTNPFGMREKSTHRTHEGRDLDLDHLLLAGWPREAVQRTSVYLDPRDAGPGQGASDHAAVMLELDLDLPVQTR